MNGEINAISWGKWREEGQWDYIGTSGGGPSKMPK